MRTLLFQDLVREVQRVRGGDWVDIEEHLAFHRLLARYDGTSVTELRDAIVALFARSADQAREIAEAFDALYVQSDVAVAPGAFESPAEASEQADGRAVDSTSGKTTNALRAWVLGVTLAMGVAVGAVAYVDGWGSDGGAGTGATGGTAGGAAIVEIGPVEVHPIANGETTPSPPEHWPPRPQVIWFALLVGALGLAFFGFKEAHRRLSAWHEQRWEKFSHLEGERDYRVSVDRRQRAAPFTLEQLTVALEGVAGKLLQGTRLDIAETVRRTVERTVPSLVFERRTSVGRLLVLRDIGPSMMPWRTKIDRLLAELERQTVVELLYFDDDPTQVSHAPGRRPRPLHSWVNHCGGLPLLVLTDGRFCAKDRLAPLRLREGLEPWPVRVALLPVDDREAWPEELTRGDSVLPGFAMNRAGYRALLRWLPSRANDARRRFQADNPSLWPGDVFRLRGMLSFLPQPSFEVAGLLRAELLPNAPDSILLTLDPVLRPTPQSAREVAEARTWLREWFRQNPSQAEAFEKFWQEYVAEPAAGTAAHQRYMRDRALMELYLAGSADESRLEQLTEAFAESPIADDWYRELERLRADRNAPPDLVGRARRIQQTTRAAENRNGATRRPAGWSVPQPWILLTACAGAFGVVVPLGVLVAPRDGEPTPPASGSAPPPETKCPQGSERCGGKECIDLASDARYCGDCKNACKNGEVCQAGKCGCASPSVTCGGRCVDLRSDATNCGSCRQSCAPGSACVNGKCELCAGTELTDCNGKCVNLQTDSANCGQCDRRCGVANASRRCTAGECSVPQCFGGFANCDARVRNGCEVKLLGDPENCGKCGYRCPAMPHRPPVCSKGYCTLPECERGWADCDKVVENGCEANLGAATSCGQCKNQCQKAEGCSAGRCSPTCESTCERNAATCVKRCSGGKGTLRSTVSGNLFGAPEGKPAPKAPPAAEVPFSVEQQPPCTDGCASAKRRCLSACAAGPVAD